MRHSLTIRDVLPRWRARVQQVRCVRRQQAGRRSDHELLVQRRSTRQLMQKALLEACRSRQQAAGGGGDGDGGGMTRPTTFSARPPRACCRQGVWKGEGRGSWETRMKRATTWPTCQQLSRRPSRPSPPRASRSGGVCVRMAQMQETRARGRAGQGQGRRRKMQGQGRRRKGARARNVGPCSRCLSLHFCVTLARTYAMRSEARAATLHSSISCVTDSIARVSRPRWSWSRFCAG